MRHHNRHSEHSIRVFLVPIPLLMLDYQLVMNILMCMKLRKGV